MYNDNDSAVGGFLGLVTLGLTAFLGYKSGEKNAYKRISDQQRDQEIADLKHQIAILNCKKAPEIPE